MLFLLVPSRKHKQKAQTHNAQVHSVQPHQPPQSTRAAFLSCQTPVKCAGVACAISKLVTHCACSKPAQKACHQHHQAVLC